MKLLPKFALLSFGVAAVPLVIAGLSSARISRYQLREAIQEQETLVAANVSNYVSSHLGHLLDILRVQLRVLVGQPEREDVFESFLHLVYHQSDDFTAVVAVDARNKRPRGSVMQQSPNPHSLLGRHEAARPEDIEKLLQALPTADVLEAGAAVGPVFPAGPDGRPHTILAVKYERGEDKPPLILAALVSLRRIEEHMATLAVDERDIFLLDRASRVVAAATNLALRQRNAAAGSAGAPGRDADRPGPPTQGTFARKQLPRTLQGTLPDYPQVFSADSGGRRVLGAYAIVPEILFGVVVERSESHALSPVRKLGQSTFFWVGVSGLVAALIGAALARSLSARVGALVEGAREIARGNLEPKLTVQSDDELGELAKGFNAMTTSLDAARMEILRQTEEITAWNETLERRVEQKSFELRETQDLLLRSRSLAAIGSLGAGVAHEINNPLTGILGLSQLLLTDLPADHPATPMVKDVEEQAQRIQSIVANLLRLAQRQAGEDWRPLDLSRVLDDALELCGPKTFRDARIAIDRRVVSPSPPMRGSAPQLQAAFMHLIQNARGAMEGRGGTLTVETSVPEERLLRLRITDTGRGISADNLPRIFDPFFTTKARRADTGIGLSVVHKIIEDHGGTIRVESEPERGTSFLITFPIDRGTSHLA
jgi:two-component system, NtrC family, sensor kinase